MEAALHIDLKEAAQIVYEAVWSDPSDPPWDLPECGPGTTNPSI